MRAHPAWASWCKLVQLFSVSIQHELAVTDIELMDDLVLEHAALFNSNVPISNKTFPTVSTQS